MRRRVFASLTSVLTAGLFLLPPAALGALADEGTPVVPAPASPRIRPPDGVLRQVDAPALAVPLASGAARAAGRELVVLVGGYQSCACPDDGTFDLLARRLVEDGFDVLRFGTDPRFPYDTYGPIAPSAIALRDQVRSVGPGYDAVHIVSHSMGGVVADQAFASGLGARDGVATYVSWSAPHSGSDAARAISITRAVGRGLGAPLRESLLWLQLEADSDAVRDLARARPVPPPARVVRLDLREASDVLVTARDARDPGVTSRVLSGPLEGHGGILTDPRAIDQTLRTITDRRVPPDDRSQLLARAAEQESERVGTAVFAAICILAAMACLATLAGRTPPVVFLERNIGRFLPRGRRRPCV